VDAVTWLGLEATDDPLRFRLPVAPRLSTGGGFLFGGAGLAAATAALEVATGRPLVWASAQYLSYARPPSVLDIEVALAVTGRQISQARATGRVDDAEIFTVNAALGRRPFEAAGSWAIRPDVPGPDDCPGRHLDPHHDDTIMSTIEMRLAEARQMDDLDGTPGDGRSAVWARVPDLDISAVTLGVLGDWVPFGIGQALGARAGGNSLDNSLRVVDLVPTDWVLLDIRVHAVAHGFGHGLVHLWAEDGSLLATASQSAIVRYWSGEGPPRRRSAPRR
jgi:acyl-CoA thioesterase II